MTSRPVTRRRRAARPVTAQYDDVDALAVPADLLPDNTLPVEERRRRSAEREAWFVAHGLRSRPGDYVRRDNAVIAGRASAGIGPPPARPDPRDFLRDLT